jgi:hypothetical protein
MTFADNIKIMAGMVLMTALGGCVKEDLSNCTPPVTPPPVVREEVLRVRAIDILSGADISQTRPVLNAHLYVFDDSGNFATQVDVRGAQLGDEVEIPIKLTSRAIGDTFHISAWGNILSTMDAQVVDGSHNLSSVFLDLSTDADEDEYAELPGDVFFGFKTITIGREDTRADDKIVHTVDITQKTARLHIVVQGMPADTSADDYYFTLGRVCDGFDFHGNPVNDDNRRIKQVGVFNAAHEYVSPQPYYMIPSIDPENIDETTATTVRLWKVGADPDGADDIDLTGRVNTDRDGDYIGLTAGQTTNVLIIFTPTGDIEVRLEVTPWNEVYQWSTWPY